MQESDVEEIMEIAHKVIGERGYVTNSEIHELHKRNSVQSIGGVMCRRHEKNDMGRIHDGKGWRYYNDTDVTLESLMGDSESHLNIYDKSAAVIFPMALTIQKGSEIIIYDLGKGHFADIINNLRKKRELKIEIKDIEDIAEKKGRRISREKFLNSYRSMGLLYEGKKEGYAFYRICYRSQEDDKLTMPLREEPRKPEKNREPINLDYDSNDPPKELKGTRQNAIKIMEDGFGRYNAEEIHSKAMEYCKNSCNIKPENLNPMTSCFENCEMWYVKNIALKAKDKK